MKAIYCMSFSSALERQARSGSGGARTKGITKQTQSGLRRPVSDTFAICGECK